MLGFIGAAVEELRKKARGPTELRNIRVQNISVVARPANRKHWLVVKAEGPMRPTFEDFLHDTELARTHRATTRHEGGEGIMAAKKSGIDFSTIDFAAIAARIIDDAVKKATMTATEIVEERVNELLSKNDTLTPAEAQATVYRGDPSLYEAARDENSYATSGGTLADRAKTLAKSGAGSAAAEVEQRIGAILSKADNKLDYEAAMNQVFCQDPGLHERWRTERA